MGTVVFIISAALALLLTRSIAREDIKKLRLIVTGLGIIGRIVDRLLGFTEKIMSMMRL
jgi:hypothetical protein